MPDDVAEGLKGVIAGETKITEIDYENGKLRFRGYDIEDLVRYSTFEEVVWLLMKGELPEPKSLEWFSQELKRDRKILTSEHRELRILLDQAYIHQPLLALSAFVNLRGAARHRADKKYLPIYALEVGTELLGMFPTVIALLIRWRQSPPRYSIPYPGESPKDPEELEKALRHVYTQPHPELSYAANFLWMLRGEEYPTKAEAKALDTALILHADHEFNASTYNGVRAAASTGAQPWACIGAALDVLSGPNHGGANEMAMLMFEDIKRPERAAQWVVDHMVNQQGRIFGFGHRLYKSRDPRTVILKDLAQKMCIEKKLPWFAVAQGVEETTLEILRGRGHEDLPPNIDFYSPVVFASLGIPALYMPLLFALGRIAGWPAHMKEQYEHNVLIRPLAKYTGPAPRPYPK